MPLSLSKKGSYVSGLTRPWLCTVGRADSSLSLPQLIHKNKVSKRSFGIKEFLCGGFTPCTPRSFLKKTSLKTSLFDTKSNLIASD